MSGGTATAVAHRAPCAVLRARPAAALRRLAATGARPGNRRTLTAAALIAGWLDAPLTVLHVREPDEHRQRNEPAAESANERALLGRDFAATTSAMRRHRSWPRQPTRASSSPGARQAHFPFDTPSSRTPPLRRS